MVTVVKIVTVKDIGLKMIHIEVKKKIVLTTAESLYKLWNNKYDDQWDSIK